jgi:acyl-CoA reductase-like NAD-dependent aldehyde dehydrogenase
MNDGLLYVGDAARAARVGARLDAGMAAVNDLEGCTYMSQSLPFGGAKKSGYDRFAGPEGLRGLCMVRSICEDRGEHPLIMPLHFT